MPNSVYPIDGCGPLAAHEDAAQYDGRWLLATPDWQPLDTEEFPQLEQVTLELRHGNLVILAPDMLRLDVVADVIEDDESVWRTLDDGGEGCTVVDEGELAGAWFSHYLETPCRLVKRLS